MKDSDISQNVMKQVTVYEKKRTHDWLLRFRILILGLCGIVFLSILYIYRSMIENHTQELFELFTEDIEIIREYWQDTIINIWEELPQVVIITAFVLICGIIGIILLTNSKRRIIKTKIQNLKKYQKFF